MRLQQAKNLLRDTANAWMGDNIFTRAASLSYYTVFSIAPLLLIAMSVAGLVFGQEAARGELQKQLTGLLGSAGAQAVQEMLANAAHPGRSVLATIVGVVVLLIGATGAFAELQDALNGMWKAKPRKTNGLWALLRARLISFTMVLVVGFMLLVSLVVSTVLAALGHLASQTIGGFEPVMQLVGTAASFGVATVLFAMIYKVLPDVKIAWRDVWFGAAVTALLFSLGRLLIGLYIGKSGVASSYGAAGSLAVLLVWVYYSSILLFTGAEFTHVYATTHGSCREGGENEQDESKKNDTDRKSVV